MLRMVAIVFISVLLSATANAQSSEEENRAIILVIDKSGSMREENRIHYVKEAAKSIARQLNDVDRLGIIGFDINPLVIVYLEMLARLRPVIDKQIERLKPGGQTYFLPAMIEARRQLERVSAVRRHVVLFSDGVTRGSQGELVDLVTIMRKESKITVSAIAIGNQADTRVMRRIALYGGGFFQLVCNPSMLPQIILDEVLSDATSSQQDQDAQKCP